QGQDFDVSGIPDEYIIGYVLTHVMTAKEAILPLAEIFQFDIIESEGMIKFNKRGSSGNEITVSDNELGIKEEGNDVPKIIVTRKQENELPTKVAIEYLNYDLDYLKDSQEYELEEEKHFKNEHSLSYAIVMEADTALQTAERMLKTAWKQNTDFELTLGIDRIEIEPSDVILTSGYRIMVTDITLHAPGYINIKGVSEDQTTYVSDAEAEEVYYVPVTQQRDMATFSQIMELPITA
ncbi:MAG: phage tail protein, partial [Bacillota bacterium]